MASFNPSVSGFGFQPQFQSLAAVPQQFQQQQFGVQQQQAALFGAPLQQATPFNGIPQFGQQQFAVAQPPTSSAFVGAQGLGIGAAQPGLVMDPNTGLPTINPNSIIGPNGLQNFATVAPVKPLAFSQSDIQSYLSTLTSQLKLVGSKNNAIARSYISSSGAFNVSPLEEGVKVHKQDDSDYYQALGYDEDGG